MRQNQWPKRHMNRRQVPDLHMREELHWLDAREQVLLQMVQLMILLYDL
jgi:hypothetical protein